MKGFIEVTPQYYKNNVELTGGEYIDYDDKVFININNIIEFSNNRIVTTFDVKRISASEEEIKRLIEEAQS